MSTPATGKTSNLDAHDGEVGRRTLVSSLTATAASVASADGAVLVLPHRRLPNVTGWFHRDVSPGFSASVLTIIRDAASSLSGSESDADVDRTPRSTWKQVTINGSTGTIGRFWLYQPQTNQPNSKAAQQWEQGDNILSPVLTHVDHWRQVQPEAVALLDLHTFSRELNAADNVHQICDATVQAFTETLAASATEIELLDDELKPLHSARSGPIPMRDGGHGDASSLAAGTIPLGAFDGWLFDVFPLVSAEGALLGIVTVYWQDDRPDQEINLSLAGMMLDLVAAAVVRSLSSRRSAAMNWAAASAFASAVDARDAYTRHHAMRVARYSREIAELLRLPPEDVKSIETAGLLHDVGKIGVPDRVLQSSGSLDEDDWDLIRRHPGIGASIAAGFPELASVAKLIRHHHERYDGTGYPCGLAGQDIPLGSRIISVVESFDTLVTGRPYQSPWTVERTLTTLEGLRNVQFDEEIVHIFCKAIRSGVIRVEIPSPTKTGDLDLHRWIGAEARAFALLQRIGNEVGELIDFARFLTRLKEIIEHEFPDSVVDIFIRDREHDQLIAIPDESRPHLENDGVYVIKPDRGIIGWVSRNGRTQNVGDVRLDPRYVAPGELPMRSELAVPMLLDDVCVGVLNLESPENSAYSRTDARVLETIASYVARAIQVAELHSQVKHETDIDSMTGLLNHRAFYHTLEVEIERAARIGDILSVAIVDVDDFKQVNDSKGHVWGDGVIRRLAAVFSRSIRHGDAVARYGGDEFAIVMPGASRENMERRMLAIEEEIRVESEQSPLPRISWGIASYPEDGERPTDLVAQADAAMYAVKQRSPA